MKLKNHKKKKKKKKNLVQVEVYTAKMSQNEGSVKLTIHSETQTHHL